MPMMTPTFHAKDDLPENDGADQWWADWTLVKGWPAGKVGPGMTDGSTRLASSRTDGSRQPLCPPMVWLGQ